jgi:hypothetical protein
MREMRPMIVYNHESRILGAVWAVIGKFCVKNKEERRGRNPQSGEDMMLGSRRVVTFKCSEVLRDRINGKGIDSG